MTFTHQQSAVTPPATYHSAMPFSEDDPTPAPVDAPVPRRGRVGKFIESLADAFASIAEFRRHERPSLDGTVCVRCTALLELERAAHPVMTACFPTSDAPSSELLAALTELGSAAQVIAYGGVGGGAVQIEWPSQIRHASPADCPNTPVGFCDVCQVIVEVYGQDGCAVGVNHRVLNIHPRYHPHKF